MMILHLLWLLGAKFSWKIKMRIVHSCFVTQVSLNLEAINYLAKMLEARNYSLHILDSEKDSKLDLAISKIFFKIS